MKKFLKFLLLNLFLTFCALAENSSENTRFVSSKSDEINTRRGPGPKYPVEWIIIKKNEPFEVIRDFGQWRNIRDRNGELGWVHSSLLSNKRYVIINSKENIDLKKLKSSNSKTIAYLEPELRCSLKSCKDNWCKINCGSNTGWVRKNTLWGVDTKF